MCSWLYLAVLPTHFFFFFFFPSRANFFPLFSRDLHAKDGSRNWRRTGAWGTSSLREKPACS